MFGHMKLGPRFTFILSIVFVAGILASGFVLWEALQNRAEAEVTAKGQMLIDMMNAVRAYTSTEVSPLPARSIACPDDLHLPDGARFRGPRGVREVSQGPAYSAFFYREAATNPTNLRNKADDFETEVLARMRSAPDRDKPVWIPIAGQRMGLLHCLAAAGVIRELSDLSRRSKAGAKESTRRLRVGDWVWVAPP